MPGIALDSKNTAVNNTDTVPDFTGFILFKLEAV